MSSKDKRAPANNPHSIAIDAKTLGQAMSQLIDRGDKESIEQVVLAVSEGVGIPRDAFTEIVSRTTARHEEIRGEFGKRLKKLAEDAKCAFDIKHPFVTIGCVKFQEKKPGLWKVSVLDSEPMTLVRSISADDLVSAALVQISLIEEALMNVEQFTKDLRAAYSVAKSEAGGRVSVNLLMLLCSHGRALKAHLGSSGQLDLKSGLARSQFGFLLSHVHRSTPNDSILLHGATQNESKPDRYISVPIATNPRGICDFRRVTALTIN